MRRNSVAQAFLPVFGDGCVFRGDEPSHQRNSSRGNRWSAMSSSRSDVGEGKPRINTNAHEWCSRREFFLRGRGILCQRCFLERGIFFWKMSWCSFAAFPLPLPSSALGFASEAPTKASSENCAAWGTPPQRKIFEGKNLAAGKNANITEHRQECLCHIAPAHYPRLSVFICGSLAPKFPSR